MTATGGEAAGADDEHSITMSLLLSLRFDFTKALAGRQLKAA